MSPLSDRNAIYRNDKMAPLSDGNDKMGERARQRHRERDSQRERERERERQTDRQTDRQTETERQRQRQKIILYYTRIKIKAQVDLFTREREGERNALLTCSQYST